MIRSKLVEGEPIEVNGHQLTVIGRLWDIDWLSGRGIWLRPTAVQHQYASGSKTYPVRDSTRLLQIGLILIGIASGVFLLGFKKRQAR